MKAFHFVIFIAILSCTACIHEKQKATEVSKQTFQVNQIIQIKGDSSLSYHLFLPAAYQSNKSLPVIIFFDPHARGALPIKKYQELANAFKVILVGSNNVQNGLKQKTYVQMISQLINHLPTQIHYDQNRMTLCGFSGGARMAGAYAMKVSFVHAVISCSASIIGNREGIQNFPFHYMGIVGYEDFNLIEMTNEFERLKNHKLIRYAGEHDWPEEEIMKEAFLMLAILSHPANNNVHVQEAVAYYKKLLKATSDHVYKQFIILKRTQEVFSGLDAGTEFSVALSEISKNTKLQEFITYMNNLRGMEMEKRHNYALAFQSEDLAWWKKELSIINERIDFIEYEEEIQMLKRLKNYFGMLGYFFTNRSMQMGELDAMWNYLQKYALVDPDNPDVFYYKAIYYVMKNEKEKAQTSLNAALEMGYKDTANLKSDPYLRSIYNRLKEEKLPVP